MRINRTELPPGAEENVYARMRAERERLARKHRAEGEEQARTIRADADRRARVIVAEAREQSERLRGAGDAESARIYADAYSRDPAFYEFVRSLEAYRKTLGEGTTLVLPPEHEFFHSFNKGGSDLVPARRLAPRPSRPRRRRLEAALRPSGLDAGELEGAERGEGQQDRPGRRARGAGAGGREAGAVLARQQEREQHHDAFQGGEREAPGPLDAQRQRHRQQREEQHEQRRR